MSQQFSTQSAHRVVALIYTVAVFCLWILYVMYVYPFVVREPNFGVGVFFNELFRAGIFLLPVWFVTPHVTAETPLRFLKLNTNVVRGFAWGIVVGLVFPLAGAVYGIYLKEGGLRLHPVPVEAWFVSLSTATLVEEIAFRGFLLEVLARGTSFWRANALTSSAFVAIHFPGWIIVDRSTIVPEKLLHLGSIFLLGLVLGYLASRTRSLWSCFATHALNNFAAIVVPL